MAPLADLKEIRTSSWKLLLPSYVTVIVVVPLPPVYLSNVKCVAYVPLKPSCQFVLEVTWNSPVPATPGVIELTGPLKEPVAVVDVPEAVAGHPVIF